MNFKKQEFSIESSREFGIRASRANSASPRVNSCRDFLTKTPTFDASLILDRFSAQMMFIIGSVLGFFDTLVPALTSARILLGTRKILGLSSLQALCNFANMEGSLHPTSNTKRRSFCIAELYFILVCEHVLVVNNHINHKVSSICFAFSFQLSLQL